MAIEDDIFELEDLVKGTDHEKALDRVLNHLTEIESRAEQDAAFRRKITEAANALGVSLGLVRLAEKPHPAPPETDRDGDTMRGCANGDITACTENIVDGKCARCGLQKF